MELLYLADLEVIGSLSHQEDSELVVVELGKTTLDLVL
jgi:hypothetical protein